MRIAFAIPLWLSFALNAQSPVYIIDTVAGSGWTGDGGPATLAILRQPGGVTADSFGNVFIAETGGHRVRKLDRSGAITTVVGTGIAGFSGDGAPATAAQVAFPYGLAADIFGNLFIADLGNRRVRRVSADGRISTIAGGGSLDPLPNLAAPGIPATTVKLAAPRNLLADDSGSLYISDFGGHRVFQLSTTGLLSALLGTGVRGYSGDGGLAGDAQLAYPAGLAAGFDGSVYVADSLNHAVRRISSGVVTTFASVGTPVGLALDVFGTLQVADLEAGGLLRFPVAGVMPPLKLPASDVVRASDFSLFVPDSAGGLVRRVSLSGEISIAAGGGDPARGDGGAATEALLNHPSGVAVDAAGNLYIADRDNHRLRRVGADGVIGTVAGDAAWSAPSGVSVDAAGNIYAVDSGARKVVRIRPGGALDQVAPGLMLRAPTSAVADARENLYIADTGAGTIFQVDSAGRASAILDKLAGPNGLALDGAGHLYFSEQDGARVRRLDLASGDVSDLGAGAWSIPRGIAVSTAGEIFVADSGRQQIMRVDSAGQVTAIAGLAGAPGSSPVPGFSGDAGAATAAQLNFPWDVAIGPGGILYVADLENHRVRRLDPQPVAVPVPVQVPVPVTVLNGASLARGPLAPGMLLVVRGSGIPATEAANTVVLINSIQVPILAMDNAQIQVQAPFTLATPADAEIVIVDNGSIATTILVPTAAAAPALFPVDPQATAAAAGAVVGFYGTGLGLGDLPVTATISGLAAEVVSLDPSPGYAGLFQIKIRVPAAAAPGKAAVMVMVGGAASQAGVNMAITAP